MSKIIILDSVQADLVRGPSASVPSSALQPVERAGSRFILGLEVLGDHAHEPHWALLESLQQLDHADPGVPAALDPEV